MGWTEERVEMLKTLWQEGLSASQIAGKMGNITRNAVIGKVHRLGLSGRATTPKRTPSAPRKNIVRRAVPLPKPAQSSAPDPRHEPVPPAEPDCQPLMIDITSLRENMCKWPIGDPSQADFAFCGRPRTPGGSYCQAHARMAFQPLRKRNAQTSTTEPLSASHRRLAG